MGTTQGLDVRYGFARRTIDVAGWFIPGALLALLPKCPMCLAAYIAMFSGVALPFSTASYLRTSLIAACMAALSYLAMRKAFRYLATRTRHP